MSALDQRCRAITPLLPAANTTALMLVLAAVFSIAQAASAQTFRLLYQFKSGPDGDNPYASLILDAEGNLYGTTMIDGAYSCGTVFKVSPEGKETVLHSFTGTGGDGANPVAPLTRDAAGNLYGTTEYGGLFGGACGGNGCGVVFKLDPAGKETVLYRFTGIPQVDGMNPQQGLVRDSKGNLYGTTSQGGIYSYGNSYGTVFKIDPAGEETLLHSFNPFTPPYDDGWFPIGGSLLRDADGNLYGTTYIGGVYYRGIVFELDPNGIESVLYGFGSAGAGDGALPSGTMVRDPAGSLYGTTIQGGAVGAGTVFKLDPNNKETIIHSFAATATDGAVPGGGLVRDSAANLYGTTSEGGSLLYGTVFKLDSSGKETILHNFSGKNGDWPELGVVRDSKGNLYGTTQYGGAYGGGVVFKVSP